MRDAITPVISYNYGTGDTSRVSEGIKWGLVYTCGIMAIGMVILQFFGSPIASVFGLSGETASLCLSAMRIISLSFIFAGANVAFQGIFQALGHGAYSLIISVFRQFLFIVPPAFLLSLIAIKNTAKTWAVWLSFPFAEIITAAVGVLLLSKAVKRIRSSKPAAE